MPLYKSKPQVERRMLHYLDAVNFLMQFHNAKLEYKGVNKFIASCDHNEPIIGEGSTLFYAIDDALLKIDVLNDKSRKASE